MSAATELRGRWYCACNYEMIETSRKRFLCTKCGWSFSLRWMDRLMNDLRGGRPRYLSKRKKREIKAIMDESLRQSPGKEGQS